ncbi:hypothetical protein MIR68_002869 [Amoeboaphelidium protococcarum]|nr:hypothetical protein MIR68_002869 [Amoeboaphelidium protococcarum]
MRRSHGIRDLLQRMNLGWVQCRVCCSELMIHCCSKQSEAITIEFNGIVSEIGGLQRRTPGCISSQSVQVESLWAIIPVQTCCRSGVTVPKGCVYIPASHRSWYVCRCWSKVFYPSFCNAITMALTSCKWLSEQLCLPRLSADDMMLDNVQNQSPGYMHWLLISGRPPHAIQTALHRFIEKHSLCFIQISELC